MSDVKRCYVCGKPILPGTFHYSVGAHSYVCGNGDCYDFYFWDDLATHMINDKHHEFVIVDRRVYIVGSKNDCPRGFGGDYWAIQFNDGTYVETNSLWYKGELPARLDADFPDNARFVTHEKRKFD